MRLLAAFFRFVLTLARELSDENAYARHLADTGSPHSGAAWREFSDRRHRQKYQNAKCC
jgi:hypothetical protein